MTVPAQHCRRFHVNSGLWLQDTCSSRKCSFMELSAPFTLMLSCILRNKELNILEHSPAWGGVLNDYIILVNYSFKTDVSDHLCTVCRMMFEILDVLNIWNTMSSCKHFDSDYQWLQLIVHQTWAKEIQSFSVQRVSSLVLVLVVTVTTSLSATATRARPESPSRPDRA